MSPTAMILPPISGDRYRPRDDRLRRSRKLAEIADVAFRSGPERWFVYASNGDGAIVEWREDEWQEVVTSAEDPAGDGSGAFGGRRKADLARARRRALP